MIVQRPGLIPDPGTLHYHFATSNHFFLHNLYSLSDFYYNFVPETRGQAKDVRPDGRPATAHLVTLTEHVSTLLHVQLHSTPEQLRQVLHDNRHAHR